MVQQRGGYSQPRVIFCALRVLSKPDSLEQTAPEPKYVSITWDDYAVGVEDFKVKRSEFGRTASQVQKNFRKQETQQPMGERDMQGFTEHEELELLREMVDKLCGKNFDLKQQVKNLRGDIATLIMDNRSCSFRQAESSKFPIDGGTYPGITSDGTPMCCCPRLKSSREWTCLRTANLAFAKQQAKASGQEGEGGSEDHKEDPNESPPPPYCISIAEDYRQQRRIPLWDTKDGAVS